MVLYCTGNSWRETNVKPLVILPKQTCFHMLKLSVFIMHLSLINNFFLQHCTSFFIFWRQPFSWHVVCHFFLYFEWSSGLGNIVRDAEKESVRNRGCRVLANLCQTSACCDIIHEDHADVLGAIVLQLSKTTDKDCQVTYCRTIRYRTCLCCWRCYSIKLPVVLFWKKNNSLVVYFWLCFDIVLHVTQPLFNGFLVQSGLASCHLTFILFLFLLS